MSSYLSLTIKGRVKDLVLGILLIIYSEIWSSAFNSLNFDQENERKIFEFVAQGIFYFRSDSRSDALRLSYSLKHSLLVFPRKRQYEAFLRKRFRFKAKRKNHSKS